MTAFSSNLDRLRIATPCPISWEQMTGNDRVRFCGHCQLNVYNLSELSRSEAESLIASTEGRLCARIYRRADGTVLTKDCPEGLRALRRRISKRVAAVFAAIVSVSSAGVSQQQSTTDKQSCPSQTKITRSKAIDNSASAVSGTVFDPTGAVIPGANVTLLNETTNEKTTTMADARGRFAFASVSPGMYEVLMESPGFVSFRWIHLEVPANQIIDLDTYVAVTNEPLSGVVSIIDPDAELRKEKPATTTITDKMIKRLPLN
jgi:carboxypeptidase family protein